MSARVMPEEAGGKKNRYRVSVNDREYAEPGEKPRSYSEGEVVVVRIPLATDTDYSFYCDDVDMSRDVEGGCMCLSFIMPDHPVKISFTSRNIMVNPLFGRDPSDPPAMGMMGMDMMDSLKKMVMVNMGAGSSPEDENGETVVCPCCRQTVPARKFCRECGAVLKTN